MKRRVIGVPPSQQERMPEHLRAPLLARMARLYDPNEPAPEESWSPSLSLQEQESCWRWCRAYRRAQDERQAWLVEHGYTDALGRVDWRRLTADQACWDAAS